MPRYCKSITKYFGSAAKTCVVVHGFATSYYLILPRSVLSDISFPCPPCTGLIVPVLPRPCAQHPRDDVRWQSAGSSLPLTWRTRSIQGHALWKGQGSHGERRTLATGGHYSAGTHVPQPINPDGDVLFSSAARPGGKFVPQLRDVVPARYMGTAIAR